MRWCSPLTPPLHNPKHWMPRGRRTSCAPRTVLITSHSSRSHRPRCRCRLGRRCYTCGWQTQRPSRLGERSQIREWLAGNRTAPPPIARSGIAIGEMPIFGPTGNLASPTRQPTTLRNDGPGADRSRETTGAGKGRRTGTPAPRRARREDRGRGRGRTVRRLRSRVALDRRQRRARDLSRAHDRTRRLRAVRRLGRSVRTQARVDHSGDEEVDPPAAGVQGRLDHQQRHPRRRRAGARHSLPRQPSRPRIRIRSA